MTISVIIPTLNEEDQIRRCISGIRRAMPTSVEIIVADGGSTDKTTAIASDERALLTFSATGRGTQCDAGAEIASGEILLFLHADTILPPDAFEVLASSFQKDRVRIGTFRLAFDSNHPLLKLYSFFSRFDSIFTRFGDQGIAVRKSFYIELGGFSHWRLFEDVQLLQLARRRTKVYSFPATVTTSARRFLTRGIVRQQFHNGLSIIRYLLDEPPDRLAVNYDGASQQRSETDVILFARYPRPGQVKTRLARTLGAEQAAELYRACVEHVFNECRKLPLSTRIHLFYSDREDESSMIRWAPISFQLLPQSGATLGDRMERAFAHVFNTGSSRAIIIGTDIPDISSELIRDAMSALTEADVVIGPTPDGGYYLLGMTRHIPELFTGIPWSTDAVFKHTLATIRQLGLRVKYLPVLLDIDTEEDLRRWTGAATPQGSHVVLRAASTILSSAAVQSN